MQIIPGIHHVTAIASSEQRNLDFYAQVLGLRLVKLTVNFDAPEVYHFYFADGHASPGSVLTFFPWTNARRGIQGTGQAEATAYSIPYGSTSFWFDRLQQHGRTVAAAVRFDEEVLRFEDPDGLPLELIASPSSDITGWEGGPVPVHHALRGFHSVTLLASNFDATATLLTDVFGFHLAGEAGSRVRFNVPSGEPGSCIDLVRAPDGEKGRMGAGVVHHVAWRVRSEEAQREWRSTLTNLGFDVTPVKDRQYFHSIYFREPGGTLFEIATDTPGFTTDEPLDCLGTALKLPPWLEPGRAEIDQALEPLRLPTACPDPA